MIVIEMQEKIRKRLEEKGHTDPDKALENFGVKVEQKAEPRFTNEGFMWYGNMITDPTKDETGRFTVDPRVYYATHYEQWLIWKERRSGNVQNVTQEGEVDQKEGPESALIFSSPEYQLALANIGAAWRTWRQGQSNDELDTRLDSVRGLVLNKIADQLR